MADIARIKGNVSQMIGMGAPESDIDAYLAGEGVSAGDLRGAGVSVPADVLKSAGIGAVEGTIGMAGAGGDARNMASTATDYLGNKLGISPDHIQAFKNAATMAAGAVPGIGAVFQGPSSADIQKAIEGRTGQFYQPQTTAGDYARTVGQFAPNLIAGPGGLARRAAVDVVLPAVASEAAGKATQGSSMEPAARIAAALAAGLGGGTAGRLADVRAAGVPGMAPGASRILEQSTSPSAQGTLARLGPDAMLLDANDSMRGVAQGVGVGPAREQITKALTDRQNTANARLGGDLDRTLGPAVSPVQMEADLQGQRQGLQPVYGSVASVAGPVDLRPAVDMVTSALPEQAGAPAQALQRTLEYLAPQMRGGQRRVRDSAQEALNIRQAIDDDIARAGDQPNTVRLLTEARRLVDNAIADASPDMKVLDATYSNLARTSDALRGGQTVLRTGPEAIRPADLTSQRAAMSGPEIAAQRTGVRADLDRIVGTRANDITALRLSLGRPEDWNAQKLAEVFGAQDARTIMNSVDREAAFERAYNAIVQNSQTAQRLESAQRIKGETDVRPLPTDTTMAGAVISGVRALGRKATDSLTAQRRGNVEGDLSQALTMRGPAANDMLTAIAEAGARRRGLPSKTRDYLVRAIFGANAATLDPRLRR